MRMNISVPDDLAAEVRGLDLPISRICQGALQTAVEHAKTNTALEELFAALRCLGYTATCARDLVERAVTEYPNGGAS